MGSHSSLQLLSSRSRIRRWKAASGVVHLLTLTALIFSLVWVLPNYGAKNAIQLGEEMKERQESRQLLIEALDKLARYQSYYAVVNGHFTRDLSRLDMPTALSSGTWAELRRDYEFSVLEVHPNRFLLLATGVRNSDRITIDESFRLNANFVLPPPSRTYLLEEGDRLLRLSASGLESSGGVFTRYWKLNAEDAGPVAVVGLRAPILGERRSLEPAREMASLFTAVSNQVKTQMGFDPSVAGEGERSLAAASPYKETLEAKDVNEWLQAAQLAQVAHRLELGRYAKRWEDLDRVSSYRFAERMKAVKNIRVHPIDLSGAGKASSYRLTLEGTTGDLMGEQFVVDETGVVRQVRYTETLIQQLQSNTNLLENFQINPIVDDPAQKSHP